MKSTMVNKIRKIPPVCLLISLGRLLSGRLRFSKSAIAVELRSADGSSCRIFRHIMIQPLDEESNSCVFIVSFKFAHLSHRANKLVSIIPMLLIAGYPGFMQKMYGVDPVSGFWSGLYHWRSQDDLEAYQKSFVYRMMNKRAVKGSVTSLTLPNMKLDDYRGANEIKNQKQ